MSIISFITGVTAILYSIGGLVFFFLTDYTLDLPIVSCVIGSYFVGVALIFYSRILKERKNENN